MKSMGERSHQFFVQSLDLKSSMRARTSCLCQGCRATLNRKAIKGLRAHTRHGAQRYGALRCLSVNVMLAFLFSEEEQAVPWCTSSVCPDTLGSLCYCLVLHIFRRANEAQVFSVLFGMIRKLKMCSAATRCAKRAILTRNLVWTVTDFRRQLRRLSRRRALWQN